MKKPLHFVQLVFIGLIMLANTVVSAKTTPPPPPVNDECSGAIFITSTSSSSYTTYDNYGSTVSSGVPTPSCATPMSGDVWFSAIVGSSGRLIFDSKAGTMTDGGMAIYTGSCGNLSLVACSDDKNIVNPFYDAMPQIDKMGLPVYMMVYIRFWGKAATNFGSFQLTVVSFPLQSTITNPGFESGYNGWFTTLGQQYAGNNGALTPVYFPISFNHTNDPNFEILTSGIDSFGGFPRVYSGLKSLKIGEALIYQTYDAATIEQTFTVGASNTNFIYHHAVVLRRNGHPHNIQSFFKVELFDANGISENCGLNLLIASDTASFIPVGTIGTIYKPWTSQSINLSSYIGQNVTVRFTVSDCEHVGCYGYAYLDCESQPFAIASSQDTICPGNFDTLTAPAGAFSYLWSPGGATQQTIIVNPTVTTTYACNVTTKGGGNCSEILYKTVAVGQTGSPVPAAAGNIISTCNNVAAQGQQNVFAQVAPINDADTYEWTYSGNGVSFYPSNITSGDSVFLNFSSTATSGNLQVRGLNNCGGIGLYSANYPVNVGVGVAENKADAAYTIYPNPVKDNLIIELNGNKVLHNTSVNIYNIQGQLLKQIEILQSKMEIDIKNFANGVYIVKQNSEKENFVSRFVKE